MSDCDFWFIECIGSAMGILTSMSHDPELNAHQCYVQEPLPSCQQLPS